jgi:hypothetical protein
MTLNNDSTIRQYRPQVGTLIKMSEFSDYTSRGINPWAYLRVLGIDDSTVTVRHAEYPTDEAKDTEQFTIPLHVVQVPLGWEPRYTIYCKPEEVEKVLGWFTRGVVTRANHDLGSSRGPVWQPMDNSGTPHWSYPEVSDAIPPEDCRRLLRVVKVETEEVSLGHKPNCSFCHGTGRDSVQRIAEVREVSLEKLAEDKGLFTRLVNYDPRTGMFDCHCNMTLGDLGRTKRAKAIKDMEKDGWSVKYVPYTGGFWERQRETVVHDWE